MHLKIEKQFCSTQIETTMPLKQPTKPPAALLGTTSWWPVSLRSGGFHDPGTFVACRAPQLTSGWPADHLVAEATIHQVLYGQKGAAFWLGLGEVFSKIRGFGLWYSRICGHFQGTPWKWMLVDPCSILEALQTLWHLENHSFVGPLSLSLMSHPIFLLWTLNCNHLEGTRRVFLLVSVIQKQMVLWRKEKEEKDEENLGDLWLPQVFVVWNCHLRLWVPPGESISLTESKFSIDGLPFGKQTWIWICKIKHLIHDVPITYGGRCSRFPCLIWLKENSRSSWGWKRMPPWTPWCSSRHWRRKSKGRSPRSGS